MSLVELERIGLTCAPAPMVVAEARRCWLCHAVPPRRGGERLGRLTALRGWCAAVYTICGVIDPPCIGYYAPDWFKHETTTSGSSARSRGVLRRESIAREPGDVALFRFGNASAHAAIVTEVAADHSRRSRSRARDRDLRRSKRAAHSIDASRAPGLRGGGMSNIAAALGLGPRKSRASRPSTTRPGGELRDADPDRVRGRIVSRRR